MDWDNLLRAVYFIGFVAYIIGTIRADRAWRRTNDALTHAMMNLADTEVWLMRAKLEYNYAKRDKEERNDKSFP